MIVYMRKLIFEMHVTYLYENFITEKSTEFLETVYLPTIGSKCKKQFVCYVLLESNSQVNNKVMSSLSLPDHTVSGQAVYQYLVYIL